MSKWLKPSVVCGAGGVGGFEQLFWSQTIVPTVSEIVLAFVPGVSFPARERSTVQAFTGDCLFSR